MSPAGAARRFVVALGFLTRLPLPAVAATPDDFVAAIRWYPAAGLVIGATVAAAAWAGSAIDAWTGALAALAAWVLVTGALHLDGLGDVADGVGAAHGDPRRLLAVMADPHIGSFGVVAIAVQLLAKLVLLHAVLGTATIGPLVLVPAAARLAPLAWARRLPSLGHGLGAAVARAVRPRDLALAAVLLAIGSAIVPALVALLPLGLAWGWWVRRRLGGVNGDAHGAGIELVETGLLLALAIVRQL